MAGDLDRRLAGGLQVVGEAEQRHLRGRVVRLGRQLLDGPVVDLTPALDDRDEGLRDAVLVRCRAAEGGLRDQQLDDRPPAGAGLHRPADQFAGRLLDLQPAGRDRLAHVLRLLGADDADGQRPRPRERDVLLRGVRTADELLVLATVRRGRAVLGELPKQAGRVGGRGHGRGGEEQGEQAKRHGAVSDR